MRTLTFTLLFATQVLYAQMEKPIRMNWEIWSDSAAFFSGPVPIASGYGEHSEELSQEYGGKTFFTDGTSYYAINCAADYYLWYINTYPSAFNDPHIYEFYYLSEDDMRMIHYLTANFLGKKYPLKFEALYEEDLNEEFLNKDEKLANQGDSYKWKDWQEASKQAAIRSRVRCRSCK